MTEICFYSILVSFLCLGIKVFIATYLILRERILHNGIKTNLDKLLHSKKKTKKVKYEWYKHDLMTYFDDLKYSEFAKDTDSYFENVTRINFGIIHNECRGDKLQNPERYYRTIRNKDFKNYEQHVQNNAISSAIRSERDDIHFEHAVLKKLFNGKTAVENELTSNGFFVKKQKKTTDFTKLKF